MNKWQKEARFTLIVMALALALSLAAIGVLRFVFNQEWSRAAAGFAFMALMALSRVDPSMFAIKSKKPPLDERDLLIKRRAMIAAYWGFWPIFVTMAMVPFFVYGPDGKVPVTYLCSMVFVGMFVVMTLYSAAILNEYGWRNNENE